MADRTREGEGLPSGALLVYPLDYTFKIIGYAADDFPEHARQVVARFATSVPPEKVTVRASAKGRYHSVSVVARLESEDQRRAVYEALWKDPRVVYRL